MNEKVKLGIVIAGIASLSLGAALWDTGHISTNPVPRPEGLRVAAVGQPKTAESSRNRQNDQTTLQQPMPTIKSVASPQANADANCFEGEQPSECDNRKIQHAVARFTFWLIVVGAAQVVVGVFTLGLYRSMRRDAMVKERAFVINREIKAFWLYDPNNEKRIVAWRLVPVLENSGGTVATEVTTWVNWQAFTPDIPAGFDFPQLGTERLVIIPHLMAPHSIVDGPASEIGVPYLIAAKRKMIQIYLWGWTEYVDVFDPRIVHRAEFRNCVVVNGDPRVQNCSFAYPFRTRHNGIDENCYRRPGEQAPLREAPQVPLTMPFEQLEEFGILATDLASQ